MRVYRLASSQYADDLSGTGAALFGGRWNKKGMAVIYTGSSQELALLEYLVHVPAMIMPKMVLVVLEIPGDSIEELRIESLPDNSTHYPAPATLQEMGSKWVNYKRKLVLKVPSAVLPGSSNFILNVKHPRFLEVRLADQSPFNIDQRLLKNRNQ